MDTQIEDEIRLIVKQELSAFHNIAKAIPLFTTAQACKILGVERHWLVKNRLEFGPVRTTVRGPWKFSSDKVLAYKKRMVKSITAGGKIEYF